MPDWVPWQILHKGNEARRRPEDPAEWPSDWPVSWVPNVDWKTLPIWYTLEQGLDEKVRLTQERLQEQARQQAIAERQRKDKERAEELRAQEEAEKQARVLRAKEEAEKQARKVQAAKEASLKVEQAAAEAKRVKETQAAQKAQETDSGVVEVEGKTDHKSSAPQEDTRDGQRSEEPGVCTKDSASDQCSNSGMDEEHEELVFGFHQKLEPLEGRCHQRIEGFWTYELCHGRNITQYHASQTDDGEHRSPNNLLGVVASTKRYTGLDANPLLTVQMTHGLDCGEAGPRETTVTYVCLEGKHALTDRIDLVNETSTCRYTLTFYTPLLCAQKPKAQEFLPGAGAGEETVHQLRVATKVAMVPKTEAVLEGPMALKNRIGTQVSHCFSLNMSCSMTMWLWLKQPDLSTPQIEQAIVTAKEPPNTISPHILTGFQQAPGHLFCGMNTVSQNQMVGSFSQGTLQYENWHHIAIVFIQGARLECIVDGVVQTSVAVKAALEPRPLESLTNMYLGGSMRWHVSVTGVLADVHMHHNQVLDVRQIKEAMARWEKYELKKTPSVNALVETTQGVEPANRGIALPQGNQSLAHWHYVDELLDGKDYALLALGYRHLQGNGGLEESCPAAASYYKAAADLAIKEIESQDSAAVEFVRLSEEIEKGDAFVGHRGEDDDMVKYQQQLADAGDPYAQAWLGHRYYWGAGGVPRDRARAVQYLDRAARQGNVEAQYNLGVMHAYGHGVERNRERSLELFRQAADQGYVAAQNGLALSLTDGSPDNNFTEAFQYFNRSAQSGNPDGLYNAALLLRDGRGVEKNETLAYLYMVKATQADHQTARLALGWMLLEGRGVEASCTQGVKYLKAAAERGRWGLLLRDGLEAYLREDIQMALQHYEAAAELGYEVAQSNAAWLYTNHCPSPACDLTPQEASRKALYWYGKAAENGNPQAKRMIGDAHWSGEGMDQDTSKALEYYKVGAESGDGQSAFNLAWAFYSGHGTDRNITQARGLIKRLVATGAVSTAVYPAAILGAIIETEILVRTLSTEEWSWSTLSKFTHESSFAALLNL
mmetsp:Transcript_38732/g.60403  ORF Transcript_38732/g.60403 Transcript_38732/m.60403 type:complete len:1056 (-) Transcript_38732:48-3215(-)